MTKPTDLRVFGDYKQQRIIADLLDDIARLQRKLEDLESEVRWLRDHMPEPDLRYMG